MNNDRFNLSSNLRTGKNNNNKTDINRNKKFKDKKNNYNKNFNKEGNSNRLFKKESDYSKTRDDSKPSFERKDDRVKKEQYLEIGGKFKVKIQAYTFEGLGIAKINAPKKDGTLVENFPLFIFGIMKNEEGFVQITRLEKNYGYANLLRLFDKNQSINRIKPICPLYGECGGCNIMHMNYEGQLKFKKEMVDNTLSHLGGISNIDVLDPIGMSGKPFAYRNKVQVPVAQKYNKMLCGFYKRETHDIIPLQQCYIQSDKSTDIVKFTRNLLNEYGLIGYDEKKNTGDVRHILVRKNYNESNIMIVIVLTNKRILQLPYLSEFINKIKTRFPEVTSIMGNVNANKGNTIMGTENFKIDGDEYIIDNLLGCQFKIGVTSFYQVNHEQCEKLYSKAFEKANLKEDDVVIDAYCGIGTIGLLAAKKVKKVYAVEIIPEAIKNAKENAKLNNISNIDFSLGKAEEQIIKWNEDGIKPSVVFIDPPRKGCDKKFLETLVKMNIKKIVYISCDISSLTRDLKFMFDNDYVSYEIQPVDLFPQTNHIENVILITKKVIE